MAKEMTLTIENRLSMEKRDMNVYHHAARSAHMISYDSSISLALKPVVEDDYVHVSIVSGPGHLKRKSVLNLPSWLDFEFSSEGKITVTHAGDRTLLKIPAGPPVWQLKMTRSNSSVTDKVSDRVTIADNQAGYSVPD